MSVKITSLHLSAVGCVGECSIDAADKAHPNKLPFSGTLLTLDTASNRPPHGAEGHRIYVPSAVAKKRLSTLINMGLNYTKALDTHAPRHKVGIITGAWIDGKKLMVRGFIWKKDFPEAAKDLHAGNIGMSMELADVYVRSKDEDVWHLEDFHFSGATALLKSAAAYQSTALAAAAALVRIGGGSMKTKVKVREVAAGSDQSKLLVNALGKSLGPMIANAVSEGLKPFVVFASKQGKAVKALAASVEELKVSHIEAAKDDVENDEEVIEVEADADEDVEADADEIEADAADEEDDADEPPAKKKKGGADEEDDDDDAELDAAMADLSDSPESQGETGEENDDVKNRGDKTTRTGKIGKAKHMAVKAGSIAASSLVRELYASHRALRTKYKTLRASAEKKNEELSNKVEALEAQVEQYAERVDRKSVPAELGNFLNKAGHDVREMFANGTKLTVQQVDEMFANSPVQLDVTTRMWMKNQLLERNLMEQGEVHRGL